MRKKHVVALTDDQRAALDDRDRGALTRRKRNRVHLLLRADAGETDADIADAVVWLLSVEARYITGHTLPVDGGVCAM